MRHLFYADLVATGSALSRARLDNPREMFSCLLKMILNLSALRLRSPRPRPAVVR